MGYFAMLIACLLAAAGYHGLKRRSIWDNVEAGCFNGCLAVAGAVVAFAILCIVLHLGQAYWSHVAFGIGSFLGSYFLLRLCDCIERLWNRRRKDSS